nr:MAG TPA: hypothetical protein [Caudoviricetes sp.]
MMYDAYASYGGFAPSSTSTVSLARLPRSFSSIEKVGLTSFSNFLPNNIAVLLPFEIIYDHIDLVAAEDIALFEVANIPSVLHQSSNRRPTLVTRQATNELLSLRLISMYTKHDKRCKLIREFNHCENAPYVFRPSHGSPGNELDRNIDHVKEQELQNISVVLSVRVLKYPNVNRDLGPLSKTLSSLPSLRLSLVE